MALQVWLPLNKDLRNTGLNNDIPITTVGDASFINNSSPVGDKTAIFRSNTGRIQLNDFAITMRNASELSICIFAYPYVSTNQLIFSLWRSYFAFTIWNNAFWLRTASTGDNGTGQKLTDLPSIEPNKWTHYACTFNRGTTKIYINGEFYTSGKTVDNDVMLNTLDKFYIGNYTSPYFYSGCTCDFRAYDNEITEEDIKRIYQRKVFDLVPYKDGIRGGILFDRSGYCLSAVTPYSLTYKHSCVYLKGSASSIKTPPLSAMTNSGIFTMNAWFLRKEFGAARWETLFGGPSGFELETRPAASAITALVAYSWGGNSVDKYIPYELNKWVMVTMTRTTSNSKFYINGELKYTGSAGSIPSGEYFIGSWKVYNSQNMKANISNFQMFKKEFTVDEIVELYEKEKEMFLPDDYEELEYIQSDGAQFIDTQIKPCMNKIRCICDMSPLNNADTPFFGSRGTYYMFYLVSGNYFWPISKCETIQGTLAIGEKYHIDWNKGTLIVTGPNGVYQKGVRSNNTLDTYNMYIFNFNPKDSSRTCVAKLYNFKIYFDDLLVRNFIPAKRKSDNEIGLYDLISRQFFTNAGTGAFTGA